MTGFLHASGAVRQKILAGILLPFGAVLHDERQDDSQSLKPIRAHRQL